jgi:hypothetical protein
MHTNEKAASAGTDSGSEGIAGSAYCPPEQAATQRAAILAHLTQHGSISTLEARRWYSVMSPASRVFELRRQGHSITTTRDPRQKCAVYHLLGGGDHAKQG